MAVEPPYQPWTILFIPCYFQLLRLLLAAESNSKMLHLSNFLTGPLSYESTAIWEQIS